MTTEARIVGRDRRSIACEERGRVDYAVLLVEGEVGDVRAYRGIGSDAFILAHGDPLTYTEAVAHFPTGILRERYRR